MDMNKITIAGIRRGNQYSPNHIGNDAAIFDLTAEHLRARGCTVREYTEAEFLHREIPEKCIFNMVRSHESIEKLQTLENDGYTVVNSAFGIANCIRRRMTELLTARGVPHPESLIENTSDDPTADLERMDFHDCWIKRGDHHAIHREDVTYVRNREEAKSVLQEYALRGIPSAVINEHLQGDLVKFYGVEGTDFFFWFYPCDRQHSKFGLEAINGRAQGIPFSEIYLRDICNTAAHVLNIRIYGGDCIVAEDSTIRIIDFNDWPSFAPCREEAAPYIAGCIYDTLTSQR